MPGCKGCKAEAPATDTPRYDVFNPSFDVEGDDPAEWGPYCADCWPATESARIIAALPSE